MMNNILETKSDQKVAYLVISHGFFIDTFALMYSTIEDSTDFTILTNMFINDYTQNTLNLADIDPFFQQEKFPDETWCKYCAITSAYLTMENEKFSFKT